MNQMELTKNSVIQRNQDIIFSDMDGETVLMSIEHGSYFGLDAMATRIWDLLEDKTSIETICSKLCAEYAVSEETCLTETLAVLEKMLEYHVIMTSDKSPCE